jgi:GTP pyrophosphokinase
MKEERKKKGELGKEALVRKFRNLKLDFEENINILSSHYGFNNRADLYYAIASNHFNLASISKLNVENGKLVFRKAEEPPQAKKAKQETKYIGKPKLLINGEDASNLNYSLATCCNPVKGDNIFGYMSANAGLKIHRSNCPNAIHLMANYGYRIMKSEWISSPESSFVVDLLITGIDDGPGVIQKLTETISKNLGINIRSFSISGNQGFFEGKVSLVVINKDQLNQVILALNAIDGISNVTRLD